MTVAPADVDGAVQQLADIGFKDVDRRIVADVLHAHPRLAHVAQEWGWGDTEVRDGLYIGLWSYLTGQHPEARLDPDRQTEEILRDKQIEEGLRAWQERQAEQTSTDPIVPKPGSFRPGAVNVRLVCPPDVMDVALDRLSDFYGDAWTPSSRPPVRSSDGHLMLTGTLIVPVPDPGREDQRSEESR